MSDFDPVAFGRMQAELEQTRSEMSELKDAVRNLTRLIDEGRGSWKTLVVVGSIMLALGTASSKILTFLGWR